MCVRAYASLHHRVRPGSTCVFLRLPCVILRIAGACPANMAQAREHTYQPGHVSWKNLWKKPMPSTISVRPTPPVVTCRSSPVSALCGLAGGRRGCAVASASKAFLLPARTLAAHLLPRERCEVDGLRRDCGTVVAQRREAPHAHFALQMSCRSVTACLQRLRMTGSARTRHEPRAGASGAGGGVLDRPRWSVVAERASGRAGKRTSGRGWRGRAGGICLP